MYTVYTYIYTRMYDLYPGWWFGTFFWYFHILGIIISTDKYFSDGLKPPTSIYVYVCVRSICRHIQHWKIRRKCLDIFAYVCGISWEAIGCTDIHMTCRYGVCHKSGHPKKYFNVSHHVSIWHLLHSRLLDKVIFWVKAKPWIFMVYELLPSGKLTQLWKNTNLNGNTHNNWQFP